MRISSLLACSALLLLATPLLAGDDPALKQALDDKLLAGDWIYDDIDEGFKQAKKSGKPLLISFRCVP